MHPLLKYYKYFVAALFGLCGFWLSQSNRDDRKATQRLTKVEGNGIAIQSTDADSRPSPGGMLVTLDHLKSQIAPRLNGMKSTLQDFVIITPEFAEFFQLRGNETKMLEERLTRLKKACNTLDLANYRLISQTEDTTVIEVSPYEEQAKELWAGLKQELSNELGEARSSGVLALLEKDRNELTLGFGKYKKTITVTTFANGTISLNVGAGPHGYGSQVNETGGISTNLVPGNLSHLLAIKSIQK